MEGNGGVVNLRRTESRCDPNVPFGRELNDVVNDPCTFLSMWSASIRKGIRRSDPGGLGDGDVAVFRGSDKPLKRLVSDKVSRLSERRAPLAQSLARHQEEE